MTQNNGNNVDLTNTKDPSEVELPQTAYGLAITNLSNKPSKSSGAPMLTVTMEVTGPDTVTLPDGSVVSPAGIIINDYFPFDPNKEPAARYAKLLKFLDAVKMPRRFNADTLHEDIVIGTQLRAILRSKKEEVKDATGEVIRDSDGNPVFQYRHNVQTYLK